MSIFKWEYMDQIRFRCTSKDCHHHLTYEELILGTHELDDCQYIKITCEGCGEKFQKKEKLKHDSFECKNPCTKCQFCSQIIPIVEESQHRTSCLSRNLIKVEYQEDYMEAELPNSIVTLECPYCKHSVLKDGKEDDH
jgi:hypothetical protein